ncbi:MAG: hypothetical protein IIC02_11700 [Planctomycetes bacterium]|nr:hypothetical protein [Planctomycetota bacterium]
MELDDYAAFENVFFGPNVPVECTAFDADADTDVDLFDFSAMQTAFMMQ